MRLYTPVVLLSGWLVGICCAVLFAPILLPPTKWMHRPLFSVQKWNSLPKGCRQHVVIARQERERSGLLLSFSFCAQTIDTITTDSRSSCLVCAAHNVQWEACALCFHDRKLTLPLFFLSSPCALSLSLTLSLSLSSLQSDTNSLKCGLTAKATSDFLFNVLEPVAQWH